MLLDDRLEFCDAVSVAATAGTALIGDVVDLTLIGRNFGPGERIWAVMMVDTEIITAGNAGTIQFTLATDAQAAIAVDGSATTHFLTEAIVTDGTDANGAKCKAGATVFAVQLPIGACERYMGILSTVATTTTTAGKVNAFLTHDVAAWAAQDDGI